MIQDLSRNPEFQRDWAIANEKAKRVLDGGESRIKKVAANITHFIAREIERQVHAVFTLPGHEREKILCERLQELESDLYTKRKEKDTLLKLVDAMLGHFCEAVCKTPVDTGHEDSCDKLHVSIAKIIQKAE